MTHKLIDFWMNVKTLQNTRFIPFCRAKNMQEEECNCKHGENLKQCYVEYSDFSVI